MRHKLSDTDGPWGFSDHKTNYSRYNAKMWTRDLTGRLTQPGTLWRNMRRYRWRSGVPFTPHLVMLFVHYIYNFCSSTLSSAAPCSAVGILLSPGYRRAMNIYRATNLRMALVRSSGGLGIHSELAKQENNEEPLSTEMRNEASEQHGASNEPSGLSIQMCSHINAADLRGFCWPAPHWGGYPLPFFLLSTKPMKLLTRKLQYLSGH